MNVFRLLLLCSVMVPFAIIPAGYCWGAPSLVLVGRGNGIFEVTGQDVTEVREINLSVGYNPDTLTEPRVTQGGLTYGAMMTPDLSQVGLVKIGIISGRPQGLRGSGDMVSITFTPTGSSYGEITRFSADAVSTTGMALPVRTEIRAGGGSPVPGDPGAAVPAMVVAESAGTGQSGRIAPGTMASTGKGDGAPMPSTRPPVGGPKSVVELFREYAGPLTPDALMALFSRPLPAGFRQTPPILLEDGTTQGVVTLEIPPAGGASPNFALTGAQLVSLQVEGNRYRLRIQPDAGSVEASVMVLHNGTVTEYPLTVAPALTAGSVATGEGADEAFTRYLTGIAEGKGDLNGDGRADYLDEYLYTANFMVKNGKTSDGVPAAVPAVPTTRKAPAAPPPVVLPPSTGSPGVSGQSPVTTPLSPTGQPPVK